MVKLLNPNGVTVTSVADHRKDEYLERGFKEITAPKAEPKKPTKKKKKD